MSDKKNSSPARSEASENAESHHPEPTLGTERLLLLSLTALGVVFGDIGTSPLYAIKVCFSGEFGIGIDPANVLGVLSLIFWSLIWVISVKYLVFIMRADNEGEGGIIALMALLLPKGVKRHRKHLFLILLGLFGGALLFGDGMITPAISVLSAVEGLEVASPIFGRYVVPLTVLLLIGLFAIQRHGTARVGTIFGPIVLLWFVVLGALGLHGILRHPGVLAALNPLHAVQFFVHNRIHGFLTLGTVFLVVTGGEALYADMGHFGRKPIRFAWFTVVLPGLLLNYFGQGALLIADPAASRSPFFLLAPQWGLYPLVALSTVATIIASQAVISGSFSLARQLVQLGFMPRLFIQHTSTEEIGQIYVPRVNWVLMLATLGLVFGFRTSENLAAAYGVAVTTTMVITSIIFYYVCRERWKWSIPAATALTLSFLVADVAFFAANIIKIEHGGWFPLVIAGALFVSMTTWKRGREILSSRLRESMRPLDEFFENIKKDKPIRVPGTAVFLTSNTDLTPPALLHNLQHNHVLHERVVLLTAVTEDRPKVPSKDRLEIEEIQPGFYRMTGHYGFMETPNVPRLMLTAKGRGFDYDLEETTFFVGSETLIPTKRPGMAIWREHLFTLMARNAQKATAYFRIPVRRLMEIGVEIEL